MPLFAIIVESMNCVAPKHDIMEMEGRSVITNTSYRIVLGAVACVLITFASTLQAQEAGGSSAGSQPSAFKPEELEQLLAPLALYSDSLISQILMASTYALEVVQADRWAKQNKNLSHQGVVYERNLDRRTERIASSMFVFDPDYQWRVD